MRAINPFCNQQTTIGMPSWYIAPMSTNNPSHPKQQQETETGAGASGTGAAGNGRGVAPQTSEPADASISRSARILAVAETAFAERGFDGSVLNKIAVSAGLGNAGLIHHFKNKHTLYRAVLEDIGADLNAAISAAISAADGPESRLRAFAMTHVEWADRRPTGARLIQREIMDNADRMESAHTFPLVDYVYTGRGLVEEAKAAGVIRDLPTEVVLTMIVGTMLHAAEIRPTYRRLFATELLNDNRTWITANFDALFDMLTSQ